MCVCVCARVKLVRWVFLRAESREGGGGAPGRTINNDCGRRGEEERGREGRRPRRKSPDFTFSLLASSFKMLLCRNEPHSTRKRRGEEEKPIYCFAELRYCS